MIAGQFSQGIFCWAGLGKRRKKGLLWEKQQAKSSVASCVFTDSYCATGPKDARRLSFITSPCWSERHTGQLHPSSSPRFWEVGRLLEQSGWETVGTRIML